MSWFTILFTVLLGIYILWRWLWNRQGKPLPPGPSLWESHRIMFGMFQKDNMRQVAEELTAKYGEIFNIQFLGSNLVFLNSARIMKKVFTSSEYKDVTNDRIPSFLRSYLFKNGQDLILRDYDKLFIDMRQLIHGVAKLYGDGLEEFEVLVKDELQVMENDILQSPDMNNFNMEKAISDTVIKIVHIFITNEKTDNVRELVSNVKEFNVAVNKGAVVSINIFLTSFPFLRQVPGQYKELATELKITSQKILEMFTTEKIKKRLKGNGSLIGTLSVEQERDPRYTDDIVNGLVMDMVVGGYLTSKGYLMGFFLLMINYPEVQQKIQKELDELLGERRPTLQDRTNLPYTQAVILEVFRYIRHSPLGVPHLVKSDIEVEGYSIPNGATIITNHWTTAFDASFWKDPQVFRPERYLDDKKQLLQANDPVRNHFIPFGVGRRMCVGESFSKSRSFLFITYLLQKFKFEKGDNKLPSEYSSDWEMNGVLEPGYLNCKVSKRP